jgi:hypothetical protein
MYFNYIFFIVEYKKYIDKMLILCEIHFNKRINYEKNRYKNIKSKEEGVVSFAIDDVQERFTEFRANIWVAHTPFK